VHSPQSEATQLLAGVMQTHSDALQRLSERLSPVLRPPHQMPPAPAPRDQAPEPVAAPHTNELRSACTSVSMLTSIVCDLIDRLEA
jgi:hypothetical protein